MPDKSGCKSGKERKEMRDLCGAESVCRRSRKRGVARDVSIAERGGIRESERISGLGGLRRGRRGQQESLIGLLSTA